MNVYFAHSFETESYDGEPCDNNDRVIVEALRAFLGNSILICDPAETTIPKDNFSQRFEFCINQIRSSDVLVVNATRRLGIGVGAEMMLANKENIIVFTICPPDSYYRDFVGFHNKEWIHPFIHGLSTNIFDSVEECSKALLSIKKEKKSNASRI